MSQPSDTFKKAPKRKQSRGKHITVSLEAKKAYEAIMREKEQRERHLPPDVHRR